MHAHVDSAETARLLDGARLGDKQAFELLFARHKPFLQRLVDARLDAALKARISASDVIQETQLEAFRRLQDFLAERPLPFRLWLRRMACERVIMAQRSHLGARRRSVAREVTDARQSSFALTNAVMHHGSTPSGQVVRQELVLSVQAAIAELAEADREVLLMRMVDSLSNREVAQALGIDASAASQRYGRVLLRLRKELLKRGVIGPEG